MGRGAAWGLDKRDLLGFPAIFLAGRVGGEEFWWFPAKYKGLSATVEMTAISMRLSKDDN
jgi:hypothetical protein